MFNKIMVPLDESKLAECVLADVQKFISGCGVDTIVFTRVLETEPQLGYKETYLTERQRQEIEAERRRSATNYLEGVVSRLQPDGVKFQTEVLSGPVAESLVDYAEAHAVDLIIIATHGRSGVSRWVRGSIADRILRAAHCPVMMVRAPGTCETNL